MSATRSITVCSISLLVALLFLPRHAAARDTFTTLTAALDAVASKFHSRFGLESDSSDSDQTGFTLNLNADKVETVLDELIAAKPSYRWTLADGVYDIYPRANQDSILEIRIKSFAINNERMRETSDAISQLPEVKQWLAKQSVSRREYIVGSDTRNGELRASLTVSNRSLRTLLNLIVQTFKRSYWSVGRYGDKQQYIAIYFYE